MYIETIARIIDSENPDVLLIQFYSVLPFWKMEYIEEPPDEIKFFKNWSSKVRIKIISKLKNGKLNQYETDVISIIK